MFVEVPRSHSDTDTHDMTRNESPDCRMACRYKYASSPFSNCSLGSLLDSNFLEIFSKIHQIFLHKLFHFEGQT